MGERDYHKLVDNVMSFANEHRLMEGRKPTDMDVDSAEQQQSGTLKYTAEEWEAWQTVELDYMGKGKGGKGKGKGKGGKGGGGGKGKGKDGKETRICHWCQKPGHLIAECRAKAAGKPKVKPPPGAASLEEDTWEDDLPADGLYCDSVEVQLECRESLCRCCDVTGSHLAGSEPVDHSSEDDGFLCQECMDTLHELD